MSISRSRAPENKASFQKSNGEVDIKFKPGKDESLPDAVLKERGMFTILCSAFGGTFAFASLLKLMQDLLTFVSPLILK